MLYPEADGPQLKKWIVKRIENTSDADADVLADYVLALLHADGSPDDIRQLCETEIPDFLKEDPSAFVNDLFEAVSYKSYLPGSRPPPSKAPPPTASRPPIQPGELSYDDTPIEPSQPQARIMTAHQKGPKKRGFNDGGDGDAQQNGSDGRPSKRSTRQPRRGGRGGRGEEQNGNRDNGAMVNQQEPRGQLPNFAPFDPKAAASFGQFDPKAAGFGQFDPRAMEALLAMGPFPAFGQPYPGAPPGRKMHRCRDYDTKGFCARGNSCMFQHGDDVVFMPPTQPGHFDATGPHPQALDGEYDPTNALMAGMFGAPQNFGQPFPSERGGHHQRGRRGKNQETRRKGQPRAPFSAEGPVTDKTKSTIVVESIPEECFDEDQVRGFFSQFGNIVEVSMRPYKRLAIVKYESWAEANAAYMSPKAIFDNRFVKVFWFKDEASLGPATSPAGATSATPRADEATKSQGIAPEIDMEEFMRKQDEAQKAHEEKMRRLEEVERQRQELEKRQEELLAKQREEKAKLLAKLAKRAGGALSDKDGKSAEPKSQSEALRAQLAALEAEAMMLGIDPDVEAEHSTWPPRGGYGRGRGYPRARGYAPRGAPRGAFRGRGNQHAAYAAYSLDNRPKKVAVSGVDFTVSDTDENLRQYLFGIGEFTDIQMTASAAEITFKDRKTAEKFFYGVKLNNGVIPGIHEPVDVAWVGGSGSSSSTPTPGRNTPSNKPYSDKASAYARSAQAQRDEEANGPMESSGVSVSSDKDVHIVLDGSADQMDYDVADANQWDIE